MIAGHDDAREHVRMIADMALSNHPGDKLLAVVEAARKYRCGNTSSELALMRAVDALDGDNDD